MKRIVIAGLLLALSCVGALAQTVAATTPLPVLIITGGTYQQILAPVTNSNQRRTLSMQNNNDTTDDCRALIGGPWQVGDTLATTRTINGVTLTAKQGAIRLTPSGSITRLTGYIPGDQILVTCVTTGNSFYLDIQ